MERQHALTLLQTHSPEIQRRFGVRHLGLFGSTARDEAREDSDVDVLVEFKEPASFDGYMGLLFYLEELFGRKVDLVTETGLKSQARPHVEKDLIRVT